MFISQRQVTTQHCRESKLGHVHSYSRKKTVLDFRCDNCGEHFTRYKGDMSPTRVSNNFYHCCPNCDAKRFGQRKGVERRFIWDRPASSTDDISKL
jgi:hypothetical protein